MRARYYDQSSGRFTKRDDYEGRLGEPLTLHKYLYANGNPINGIDPTGLYTLQDIEAGLVVLGVILNSYGLVNNTYLAFNANNSIERLKYSTDAGLNLLGLILPFIGPGSSLLGASDDVIAYSANIAKPLASVLIPIGQHISLGVLFSQARHEADWELINSEGETVERGTTLSGSDIPPGRRLTWTEQLQVHTERKILDQLAGTVKRGDVITIRGTKPPCYGEHVTFAVSRNA